MTLEQLVADAKLPQKIANTIAVLGSAEEGIRFLMHSNPNLVQIAVDISQVVGSLVQVPNAEYVGNFFATLTATATLTSIPFLIRGVIGMPAGYLTRDTLQMVVQKGWQKGGYLYHKLTNPIGWWIGGSLAYLSQAHHMLSALVPGYETIDQGQKFGLYCFYSMTAVAASGLSYSIGRTLHELPTTIKDKIRRYNEVKDAVDEGKSRLKVAYTLLFGRKTEAEKWDDFNKMRITLDNDDFYLLRKEKFEKERRVFEEEYRQAPTFIGALQLAEMHLESIIEGTHLPVRKSWGMRWWEKRRKSKEAADKTGLIEEEKAFYQILYEAVRHYSLMSWSDKARYLAQHEVGLGEKIKRVKRLGEEGNAFMQEMQIFYEILAGRQNAAIQHADRFLKRNWGMLKSDLDDIEKKEMSAGEKIMRKLMRRVKDAPDYTMIAAMMNHLKHEGYGGTADVERDAVQKIRYAELLSNRVEVVRLGGETQHKAFRFGRENYYERYVYKEYAEHLTEEEKLEIVGHEVEHTAAVARVAASLNWQLFWRRLFRRTDAFEEGIDKDHLVTGYAVNPIISPTLKEVRKGKHEAVLIAETIEGRTLAELIEEEHPAAGHYITETIRYTAAMQRGVPLRGLKERDCIIYLRQNLNLIPSITQEFIDDVVANYAPVKEAVQNPAMKKVVVFDRQPENTIRTGEGVIYSVDLGSNRCGIPQIDAGKMLEYTKTIGSDQLKSEYIRLQRGLLGEKFLRGMSEEEFFCMYYNVVIDLAFSNFSSLSARPTKATVRDAFISNALTAIRQLRALPSKYYQQHEKEYLVLESCLNELQVVNQ